MKARMSNGHVQWRGAHAMDRLSCVGDVDDDDDENAPGGVRINQVCSVALAIGGACGVIVTALQTHLKSAYMIQHALTAANVLSIVTASADMMFERRPVHAVCAALRRTLDRRRS